MVQPRIVQLYNNEGSIPMEICSDDYIHTIVYEDYYLNYQKNYQNYMNNHNQNYMNNHNQNYMNNHNQNYMNNHNQNEDTRMDVEVNYNQIYQEQLLQNELQKYLVYTPPPPPPPKTQPQKLKAVKAAPPAPPKPKTKRAPSPPKRAPSPPKRAPARKTRILAPMREEVWDNHIEEKYGNSNYIPRIIYCPCCNKVPITLGRFECGHIISEFNGGETKVYNLRPICSRCNKSMGRRNWNDYVKLIR